MRHKQGGKYSGEVFNTSKGSSVRCYTIKERVNEISEDPFSPNILIFSNRSFTL